MRPLFLRLSGWFWRHRYQTSFVVVFLTAMAVLSWHIWEAGYARANPGLGPALAASWPLIVFVLGGIFLFLGWTRYTPSSRTKPHAEVLAPLLASTEEYCLILRPFGADGETVLPYRLFRTATVEQVIARAARRAIGLRTFAMVDQNQKLAPPGPVYLRAAHNDWRDPVERLIRRAHTIVLVVPPSQDLRASFAWEIEKITQLNAQRRVVIALPPADFDPETYRRARGQLCVLVTAFEGFAGSFDDIDTFKVHNWDMILPEQTILVNFRQKLHESRRQVRWWHVPPQRRRFRRSLIGVHTYASALTRIFTDAENDLAEVDFLSRYS